MILTEATEWCSVHLRYDDVTLNENSPGIGNATYYSINKETQEFLGLEFYFQTFTALSGRKYKSQLELLFFIFLDEFILETVLISKRITSK